MSMKKSFTILVLLLSLSITQALAWGVTGHRVTGWIAEKYLSKKARKELKKILRGESLAMLSTWMDEVKSDSAFDYMEEWHWATIPYGQTYEQAVKPPAGDIIMTLERVITELESKKLSREQQLFNIRILIHLVGDIHQPLHVGGRDDKGGNDVKVTWFRKDTNLHRVWDLEMIDETQLSFTELSQSLRAPTKDEMLQWQKHTVLDWAMESQSYEKAIYDIGNGRLGYHYSYRNFPTVRLRLLQAGVRLAGILNKIYG